MKIEMFLKMIYHNKISYKLTHAMQTFKIELLCCSYKWLVFTVTGSFHLLHMMVDNYLLHTLEGQFEHLQEAEYKRQMLSHYSESGNETPSVYVSQPILHVLE